MKALLFSIGLALLFAASSCSTSRMAGTDVYYDDIYYNPGVTSQTAGESFKPVPSIAKEEKKELRQEATRQVREYERSEQARAQRDTRDFAEIQEKYASILADEEQEEVDSLVYYNDETGYWVDGFDGSEMDRDYAERLVRFHGPFTRIPYWSPLYSEFVYFNDPDWNVYVDGNYAYAFPTWSNRWYDSYRFNRWSSPWSFSFGFGSSWGYPYYWGSSFYGGWHDPFYSPWRYPYYGYGYGFGGSHWYSPYHHWYSPYYGGGYYGGGYYPSGSNVARRDRVSGIRPSLNSDTRYSGNTRERVSGLKSSGESNGRRTMTTGQGTRISRDSRGSTTISNENATYQRPTRRASSLKSQSSADRQSSVSRYRGSGTSTGTVQSQSRRTTTPTYSQPKESSRPAYNRATYTRPGNTRVRSSPGTTGSGNTLKSGTTQRRVSTPTRTRSSSYNSGSSSRQRSQAATRSYTPSRSSSSSSGSFNRSSSSSRSSSFSGGSSTRSSGSSGGSRSSGTVRSGRR